MQSGNSEEHLICANSSTKQTAMHKCCNASTSLLGLLTKRSIRVEPHPQVLDIDCPERSTDEVILQANDVSFAKRSLEKPSLVLDKEENIKTQTPMPARRPPPSDVTNISRILEKSHSSGVITSTGNLPLVDKGADLKIQRSSRDGTQSDGDGKSSDDISIKLRKHVKHRSPNHNRFSHQFSLCCKVEKKSLTPPITVRYNSMQNNTQMLKKSGMSLNLNPAENIPISTVRSVSSSNYSSQTPIANKLTVCASAPQSPVSAKVANFGTSSLAHGSPSNFSLKYRSNASCSDGPIRPLAVSDCRSRLRQKLYPHGKDGNAKHENLDTHQHNSSPNIAVPVEVPESISAETESQPMRFSSYENIQLHRQGSSSGLARQALMAAQVLSLIPTEKVKDRSLVDGRLGSCSLLGPTELNRLIPTKEITIFVGTWNMNGQSPPKQMNDFVLPAPVEHMPDIVAIGTQESSPDRFEWEASLQETLGPSHVLFHSTTLGTLHLAIYMRRDLIWYCSVPEDASMSVRTGSAFRTKGAVAISFCLFGTSMLFVTSHLTAHHQKVKERVSDVKRIIHALDLPRNLNLRYKNKDVTQNFDDVFWCGDLNFRLAEPREKLLEWIQKTKFPLPSHLPHGYMHTDQLSSVLAEGAAFRGFMEANITFPPTYKYDPGTQNFDTSSKQRAPAYTDRILYKYRQMQGVMMRRTSTITGISTPPVSPHVECLLYDSVPSITTSDHKPVWALFKAIIRAGTDSIPLAAGLFSRDIYLEGIKRRMKNQYSGSSVVCSIQ